MEKRSQYILITPVRDEAQYIERTIRSVINQSFPPEKWYIVNDGSTDSTGTIIDRYVLENNWIVPIHIKNRGYRDSAGGEVSAFYHAYKMIPHRDWEFIIKLDGDLEFGCDYFKNCLVEFDVDPSLGIGGGTIENIIDGQAVPETTVFFHVRGATKIYRKACWDAIGGLQTIPGWDTIDEMKANMLGWKTRTFEHIKLQHLKHTGATEGMWKNSVKNGKANYITGYHPLFMLIKCIKRIVNKPYFVDSIGLMYGFLNGYLKNIPRVDDEELIKYVRSQQMSCLLMRKSLWT